MADETASGDMGWLAANDPEPWQQVAAAEEAWTAGRIPERYPTIRLGLTVAWGRDVTRYDPAKGPCPGCGDRFRPGRVCLVCHGTAGSPVQWPMQAKKPDKPLRAKIRKTVKV